MDAKNSPLALLAQTCSSIGKDPPSKPIIPPIEKKENNKSPSVEKSRHSASPKDLSGRKSSEINRASAPKDIPNFYPISTSSPKPEKSQMDNSRTKEEKKHIEHGSKSPSMPSSRPLSASSTGYNGLKSNMDKASPRPRTSESTKDNRDSKYSPPPKSLRSDSPIRKDSSPFHEAKHPQSLYPGLPYGPYSYPGLAYPPGAYQPSAEALAAAGYPYGLSAQSGYNLASAHALAAHQAALKSSSTAALSQYMQYASRMRAPPAVSGCKDPYCTNCLASGVPSPGSHMSQCTSPGCSQCAHEKALHGLFALPGSSHLHSPLNAPSSASLGLSHLHSLYAQNLLSQQGQQHVCNWMMGSDYCGKRFSSSEELLQHLRTHTSSSDAGLSAYGALGLSIPPSAAEVPGGLPAYLSSANVLTAFRRS